jgi:hypothetical protein
MKKKKYVPNDAINKVMGRRIHKPNNFRAFDVARDKNEVDITYEYTMADEESVVVEYDGETKQQFYPYNPYIGCYNRHLSVVADYSYDLTLYHACSARQALYR